MSTTTETTSTMSSITEMPNTSLWLKVHTFARKYLDDASTLQIKGNSSFGELFSTKKELMNLIISFKDQKESLTTIFTDMEAADVEIEQSGNTLSTLPEDMITHICGYLNRSDIDNAKLVCVNLGLRALLEMEKINNMGVINVSAERAKLFSDPYMYERLPRNITKEKILRLWSEKFDIPLERLFVFQTRLPDFQDIWLYPGQVIITYYNDTEK